MAQTSVTNWPLNRPARVALLSGRQVRHHVSDAMIYEFENCVAAMDQVDLLTYNGSPDRARQVYALTHQWVRSHTLAQWVTPSVGPVQSLEQDYDLFVVVLRNIFEVAALSSLKNWRDRSRQAVCILMEAWDKPHWLEDRRSLFEWLKPFDHIFLGNENAVAAVQAVTGRPCSYLPLGVDALSFYPYGKGHRPDGREAQARPIKVSSLGRRSDITHRALLDWARSQNIFYYYDTAYNLHFVDHEEHRSMYANLLKRSQYFICNYSRINENHNQPRYQEIAARFYEGAAAGAVLIGMAPTTERFQEQFGWEDAVIPMAFDEPQIEQVLRRLDAEPERLAAIQHRNVIQSLRRHDWAYRWRSLLETLDMPPLAALLARLEKLNRMATSLENAALSTNLSTLPSNSHAA